MLVVPGVVGLVLAPNKFEVAPWFCGVFVVFVKKPVPLGFCPGLVCWGCPVGFPNMLLVPCWGVFWVPNIPPVWAGCAVLFAGVFPHILVVVPPVPEFLSAFLPPKIELVVPP